ncbi:MAG: prepilin peptidase [Candidatus Nanopelagicaceae bacterium]
MKWFLIIVVALATYFDLKFRKIPNWLTYSAIALSFLWFSKFHLLMLALGLLVAVLLGNLIGAGDIKLAVAIALWSHILNWSQYWIFCSLLLGGIAGLIYQRKSIAFAPYMAAGLALANVARSYGFI